MKYLLFRALICIYIIKDIIIRRALLNVPSRLIAENFSRLFGAGIARRKFVRRMPRDETWPFEARSRRRVCVLRALFASRSEAKRRPTAAKDCTIARPRTFGGIDRYRAARFSRHSGWYVRNTGSEANNADTIVSAFRLFPALVESEK